MKDFFKLWLPTPATRVVAALLVAVFFAYLAALVQITGPMLFEIWHFAGRVIFNHARVGDYAYEHLRPAHENYYKLSPAFTVFPMALFGPWPLKAAGAVFNVLNGLCAAAGLAALLSVYRPPRPMGVAAVMLLLTLGLFDLHINGAYGQVTGLMVGAMLMGLACFKKGHLLTAGFFLAWAANAKLFPLVPALLLATSFKPRYLLGFFGGLVFFLLMPALFLGWTANLEFHKSLYRLLTIEKDFIYAATEVHYHYGIRAFLQANVGLKMGGGFNVLPALWAIVLATGWALHLRTSRGHLSPQALALLVLNSFSFILLFNTRTEGPATVLMGAIYVLLLVQIWGMARGMGRNLLAIFLALSFFTLSLSTTDAGKVLGVNRFFWEHNLRTLPVMALMALSTMALFYGPCFHWLCGALLDAQGKTNPGAPPTHKMVS